MSTPLSTDAVVGVVGNPPAVVDAVVDTLHASGHSSVVDSAPAVLAHEPVIVIAAGESALCSLVSHGVDVPVLPVDAGRGVRSVPPDRAGVEGAVDSLVTGDWTTVDRPVVAADPPGARVLFDLMLATADPAQISEYTVRIDDEPIASFRGDGVVVATPAGSVGYARAASGPVVTPDTDVVVVVPVGAFATDVDNWVVPVERLALRIERDETTVEVRADDRTAGAVDPDAVVRFRREDTLAIAVVEESRPFHLETL